MRATSCKIYKQRTKKTTIHLQSAFDMCRIVPRLMTLHHRLLGIGVNVENMSQSAKPDPKFCDKLTSCWGSWRNPMISDGWWYRGYRGTPMTQEKKPGFRPLGSTAPNFSVITTYHGDPKRWTHHNDHELGIYITLRKTSPWKNITINHEKMIYRDIENSLFTKGKTNKPTELCHSAADSRSPDLPRSTRLRWTKTSA